MSESDPHREPSNPAESEASSGSAPPNYADLPDAQVVELARRGQEGAGAYLLDKYRRLVRSRVQQFFLQGIERDDLLHLGMAGLWQAILDYDPGEATSFSAFATVCIDRHIQRSLQAATP